MTASPAQQLADLTLDDRAAALADLTEPEIEALLADWGFWARPEQRAPVGQWTLWARVAGRGEGKALDITTPIPTPDGWTKMGDLAIGDTVFDQAGRPCRVLAVYDQGAVPGWRLTFSDGSEIVACDEHQWVTLDTLDRKRRNRAGRGIAGWESRPTITTAQLVASLARGPRGDRNHSIPTAAPLDLPECDLLIDPYLLGVWLGDGASAGAEITCHDDDAPHYAAAAARAGEGFRLSRRRHPDRPVGTWSIGTRPYKSGPDGGRIPNGSIHSRLRALGVMRAKHVPAAYLRASREQRLALLQGLMDTDGTISAHNGCAEFTSTNRSLADAVVELARSLGQKPRLAEGRATLYGRDCGPKYRVTWRPTIPVVTLPRKVAHQRPLGAQSMRHAHRMIVRAERVDPRPMRCITVDSPSSLYLAGEAMIPTHNTRSGAEFVLDRSEQFHAGAGGQWHRVALVARTAADARDTMVEGESGLAACCERRGHVGIYQPSKRRFVIPDLLTTCTTYSAAEPDSLRGPQQHTAWADEPAAWVHKVDPQGNTAWTNMMFGLRLDPPAACGMVPQACATTTPKPIPLVVDWFIRAGLLEDPATKELRDPDPSIVITTGSMLDNIANLSPVFIQTITDTYAGTNLAAQEIYGILLSAVEGALWQPGDIDHVRRHPTLSRKVVAVDPPGGGSAECGIIVVGSAAHVGEARTRLRHAYVLDDLSVKGPPETWATVAVAAAREHRADIVAEVNFGGDMVVAAIHAIDPSITVHVVRATRGKRRRAEPVSLLYQKGRVHHVGQFGLLEAQMLTWTDEPGQPSPDRMDALVWGVSFLLPQLSMPPSSSKSTAQERVATGVTSARRRPVGPGPIRVGRNLSS